jgi:hypothetical protein
VAISKAGILSGLVGGLVQGAIACPFISLRDRFKRPSAIPRKPLVGKAARSPYSAANADVDGGGLRFAAPRGEPGMTDLSQVERRLATALDRIAKRIERGGAAPAPSDPQAEATIASLKSALEKERTANAQLSERVHQVKQRQETTVTQLERRLARLTEQLDLQSLEMLRLKKANSRLIEANSGLRLAQAEAFPDATLVNKSISAELEALQAERRAEMAEMEEILAELKPLIAVGGKN